MHRLRALVPVLVIALVIAACGGDDPDPTTTTAAGGAADTPTTASTEPETTTSAVVGVATVTGGTPGLEAAVSSLFGDRSGVDPGFSDHLAGAGSDVDAAEYEAHLGAVAGEQVAVVTDGTDVLYAVAPEGADDWTVVAGTMASLGVAPWYGSEPIQVYIIGSDARPGQSVTGYRADSHHIVTLAADGSAGSIVGIPRDAYVTTPEGTRGKFTNVMASNGPERVVATAEILTDLEYEGYVVTGFKGFVDLVDEFGGFEVEVPVRLNDDAAKAYINAGVQTLNGTNMLAFARVRKTIQGGDFTRQFHHGVIMQWGLHAVQQKGVTAIPTLLEMLERHAITDLTATQLLRITGAMSHVEPFEMTNVVVPATNGTAGGAYVARLGDGAYEIFADLADGPYLPEE